MKLGTPLPSTVKSSIAFFFTTNSVIQGRVQDFKLEGGGAHLKKSHRAEGGAKILGVFRVKNQDFTQKKSYFFQFWRGGVPGASHHGSAPVIYGPEIFAVTRQYHCFSYRYP